MTGKLYICALPIGNTGDITLRALEVLKQADYIICEDTRVTKIILDKYGISTKLLNCHKFNEKAKSAEILNLLKQGSNAVLVSDAGTPLISDPGSFLLEELIKNGIEITSLPGACAAIAFLSMLPRSTEEFAFIGFIPRTAEKQIEILNKYKNTNCVFYESPKRLMNTLENIAAGIGEDTKISIGRELTKIFEEVKTGSTADIIEYYKTHPLKGEIAAMVYARPDKDIEKAELNGKIEALQKEGFSSKDISKIISALYGINKNKVYKTLLG